MQSSLSCRICLGSLLLAVGLAGQVDYKGSLIGQYPFYKTATGRFAPVYPALAQQVVQDYGIRDKEKSGWRPLDAGLVAKARAEGITQIRLIDDGAEESWLEIRKPGKPLIVYSADSIKPALDEAVLAYQRDTGIEVRVTYCKAKQAYERVRKEGGDLLFSGHGDAYEAAKQQGLALEGSQQVLGNLRAAIAVRKGNPLGIKELADLAEPGVKVGLGDPETAQLGRVSEDVLQKAGLADAVHANVVARGDCCSTTAALLTAGKVEAEVGWADFAQRAPGEIETIPLPADLAKPLPITGLVLTTSSAPGRAGAFLRFLGDASGRAIFARQGYGSAPHDAGR